MCKNTERGSKLVRVLVQKLQKWVSDVACHDKTIGLNHDMSSKMDNKEQEPSSSKSLFKKSSFLKVEALQSFHFFYF